MEVFLTGTRARPRGSALGIGVAALTRREREVVRLAIDGQSALAIAKRLFISDRTVAVHVSRILDKLGVRNRTEAATMGAHMGLTTSAAPAASPGKEPDGHPNRR